MILKKKVTSKIDATIKYVFELNNQIVEFSYIDNGTGKDIICVPCQTMCDMACTFCHLTDYIDKIPVKNLKADIIVHGVNHIVNDLKLGDRPRLISYMGCGEPMNNIDEVYDSMLKLKANYGLIRFGMATMLPKNRFVEFFKLAHKVDNAKLNLKIHLSLHFTNDIKRLKWIPNALAVKPSIYALNLYNNFTGNKIEIHYTIMDGINDRDKDIEQLEKLLFGSDVTVKFMRYAEKESLRVKGTGIDRINEIRNQLAKSNIITEYYEPPGKDVGASCGQFLLTDIL